MNDDLKLLDPDPIKGFGQFVVHMVTNFRNDCSRHNLSENEEEFLMGVIQGVEIRVKLKYQKESPRGF